jgi:phage terminase large subunit GpA-like protein
MLGHRTEHVKNFVRQRRVRRPMASYGAKANTAPVLSRAKLQDVTWRGQTDKRGVHVFQIGTVDAKHALFAQLAADHDAREKWLNLPDTDDKPAGPELQCHFSEDLPDEFFSGLVSEVYNPSKNRFEKRRGSVRNEPLDTWVHAYAATHHPELRLHRARVGDWERWEAALLQRAPVQVASAPGAPPAPPAQPAAPATPKRRIRGRML